MSRPRLDFPVLLLFAALTLVVTFPQVRAITAVPDHSDPYFSMWRLGWVSHQIVESPGHLFEGNIFFPEHDTLAYSDAMLLPGVVLAPLFWAGFNPVVIYNVALLVAITLSAFTAFLLARRLTGCAGAALVAGAVFGYAPYRFDHYMHLELQMVFWIPLALILIHRLIDGGGLRDALLLGVVLAAQALSCVYAVVFLAAYGAVLVAGLIASAPRVRLVRFPVMLAVAGAVLLAFAVPYAQAYARAAQIVGARTLSDVAHYSASLTNYLAAPPANRLYGWTSRFGSDELFLFPGLEAIGLGLVGIAAARSRIRLAYLAALVMAFDLSRGINGFSFPWLFAHLQPFRGLRSPARIDILVDLSIAVLAAYGAQWLLSRIPRPGGRVALVALLMAGLTVEYGSAPVLSRAPSPTRIDAWLARRPPIVIVELPLAAPANGWRSRDWLYMYQGLGHRQRMLNGYSGHAPASYYSMLDAMLTFPDDRSIAYLRDRHVDYVIVRAGLYPPGEASQLMERIDGRADLALAVRFGSGTQSESAYAVRR